ncbi:12573_t:CDS:2 [Ambispora gerdemannii]|uniref:12573_t:CDS:1 n=1 Tax=Ambispora gerdemannii TaxID=144530 RepID=A0A9N8WEP8_9GLOM|nr:12573_t:CDS:2 [Ambispora gerdemannii]
MEESIDSGTSTSTSIPKKNISIDEALEKLKQQCNEEWQQIVNLQHKVVVPKQNETPLHTAQSKEIAILKQEEQRLLFEIEMGKREMKRTQNVPPIVDELLVRKQVHQIIQQYKRSIPSLRQELKNTRDKSQREKQTLEESDAINAALTLRVEKLKNHDSQDSTTIQNAEISQMQEKLAAVKQNLEFLMKELIAFLDKHFPPKSLLSDESSKNNNEDDESDELTSSLKAILEDLMNLSFSKPHDPWLLIDEAKVWSPYVELLIRAEIAVRNPKDATKIKLIEFHV